MMTTNNIQEYYDALVQATKAQESYYCYNKDREHNAAILSAMFETSSEIRMYCGSMSIFRKSFWDRFGENANIMKTFEANLNDFSNKKGNVLEIVVENYPKGGFQDLVFEKTLRKMFIGKKLKLFKLGDNVAFKEEIPHFSIATPCFVRVEQDKELHTALCAINNQELMDSSVKFYGIIEKLAISVRTL